MPFHQPLFVFGFLPVVWLGYALLSRRGSPGAVVPWLLLSSMVFYAAEDPLHLAIVAGSIIGNFAVARQLQACDDRIARKRMLALAIVANIALLVFYKARLSPWLAGNGLAAFRTGDVATLLIPLGLSFLTFEQIGALMDIHRRRVALGTLTEYSLFVMFFPHLVMGPIVAYRDLAPQLKPAAIRQPTARALAGGLFIFSVGLFKKSVTFRPACAVCRQRVRGGRQGRRLDRRRMAGGDRVPVPAVLQAFRPMPIWRSGSLACSASGCR